MKTPIYSENSIAAQRAKAALSKMADLCQQQQAQSTADNPPTSNTGGQAKSEGYTVLVSVNGEIKEVLLKRGKSTAAFIDTLTVSFPESVFVRDDQLGTEEEIAANASAEIAEIFGFGLLCKNSGGRNGYKVSYHMGTDTENYGFFASGGRNQRDTVCLFLTGVGLTAALDGWEQRLYDFIKARAPYAKITRCDLAHDFLNGEYTPEKALSEWEQGLYTSRSTKPIAEMVGGDWLQYRGTGKTLYIGSRKNASRFVRIYEKGKQLGDSDSPWVRVELELHNRDIVIPHDILINAGQYLTGAFPAFESLFFSYQETPAKAQRVEKQKDISAEHVLKYASMQTAPAIVMLERMGLEPEQIIETLKNGHTDMPKRLSPAAFDCATENLIYIHQFSRLPSGIERVMADLDVELGNVQRMKHRTYDEYRALADKQYLNEQFGSTAGKSSKAWSEDDYLLYMWRKHRTPDFLLNRNMKGN
ncbi:replication initiation factor domain-containing protein [Neisseria dentiae]|uniref:replication initiation factor domain-containing protein n=1 Tax=Neisseria dentiae TaxID=194197 RepID=UPI00211C0D7E|nr:replication initiation factor domain-containing protein [Neisseria dentiae]MCQ9327741.1 replication initiation factor domain-containing protein [Neisseria dentiae]